MAKNKKTKTYWKPKAWDEFSRFIRLRDAIKTTRTKDTVLCCSCGKPYPAFGRACLQAGHFIPGRSHILLFDELGVHGQCYNCNVKLKGNWVGYERFMLDSYDEDTVEHRKAMKYNKTFSYSWTELQEIRDYYKTLTKKLNSMGVEEAREFLSSRLLDINGRPA
jgi:hypothetical protein